MYNKVINKDSFVMERRNGYDRNAVQNNIT